MRKFIVLAALAGVSAPAFAQVESPFTGLKVEALAGYDALRPGNVRGSDVNTVEGFQYGVAVGYDMDFNGAIIGVEGEIADSTGRSDNSLNFGNGLVDSRLETGRDLYAGIRIGGRVNPRTMLYAKGGYTNARVQSRFDDGSVAVFDDRVNVDGFRLGAGAEMLITDNAYGKLEYRYSNYSSLNYGDGRFRTDTGIDLDRHQVLAGVGFRF